MPELDGFGGVRLLKKNRRGRLRETLHQAHGRLEQAKTLNSEIENVRAVAKEFETTTPTCLERLPIRRRENIVLLPMAQGAPIVADGELRQITTIHHETFTLRYRLKDTEARFDPAKFVRPGRGT